MGADVWLSIFTGGFSAMFNDDDDDDGGGGDGGGGGGDGGGTGALPGARAKDIARQRLFREGTVFTSPTGLGGTGTSASARLK